MKAVPLAETHDDEVFGCKAAMLGHAARSGLPLPPGVALPASLVEEVAGNDPAALAELLRLVEGLEPPLAVRSSAVGEDTRGATFAGQHLTLLNVTSVGELAAAVTEVWRSGSSESALAYRRRVGMDGRPNVGVVVQRLVFPDVAGVMFTRDPLTGADERLIEASWGLGEAVVAGLVIPDLYRLSRSGEVLERRPGLKNVAVRPDPNGGTFEESLPPELAERMCLDDAKLGELHSLAERCEEAFGGPRDLEWGFVGENLYLLQSRALTQIPGR